VNSKHKVYQKWMQQIQNRKSEYDKQNSKQ